MRRLARILAGVLVGVAIFVASGEVLARALGIVDRLNGYSRLIFTAGPDAAMPYRLRPGVRTRWVGIDVRVNDFGLRGPETTVAPAPGTTRVLVLGDSVVFGQGVPEDETLAAVLERTLTASDSGRWEVLNAGVQGYDTVAEARFLESFGLALQPQLVVVGMSLNDFDAAPAFHPVGVLTNAAAAGRRSWLSRSEFVLLLQWLAKWARGSLWQQVYAQPSGDEMAADTSQALAAAVARKHLGFYAAPPPRRWERLRRALTDLRDRCRSAGVSLVVVIFPESYQVGPSDPDLTPQRRLGTLCDDLGLRCLDLQAAFAAAGGDLFDDVSHPNAAGHALAAETIATALLAESEGVPAARAPGHTVRRRARTTV
jgi:lysophospholipase L1-like esterase